MAIGDMLKSFGQGIDRGFTKIGGYDPSQQVSPEEALMRKNAGIEALQRTLGRSSAILSGDPQRLALSAQQDEAARKKQFMDDYMRKNPGQAELLRALQAGVPASMLTGGKKQTYKPELVEYKNTSSKNIKIGNNVIKPGEQIPFNVSIPEIANSISGKPGLVEVKEKTIYSRPGSLYTTDKGDYREMIIGDRQQFSGPEGTFTSEEFFAKYPLTRTKTASEEARYIPDVKAFNKINTDLVSVEKSMFQTENYWKNVKNSNIGMEKLGDQISQWFTTLAGQQNLTEDQLYRAISQGQLQGLIGANRIDTVGGGVMTEKDAWRILTRLGGEVNALQNPSVVGPLLQEMYELKVFDYNEQIKSYNNAVDSGKFKGYEKRNPITSEEVTSRFALLPNGIPAGSKKINVQGTTLYQKGNKYYAVLPNGTVEEVDID